MNVRISFVDAKESRLVIISNANLATVEQQIVRKRDGRYVRIHGGGAAQDERNHAWREGGRDYIAA